MLPSFGLRLTPRRTLAVVQALRAIALVSQLTVLGLAISVFAIALPASKLLSGIGLLFLLWLTTVARLRRQWPVTELEVAFHLSLDIGVLTWLLYLSGGSANPFVSAYLVPIALTAIALRPRYGVVIALLCSSAYTALLKFHLPLSLGHQGPVSGFDLHVLGMWVNFILSACLIAGLLWVLAEGIRRRDRLINQAREDVLRNEHVVALGTLAAGAAHELSTPLSTVALLAEELSLELTDRPQAQADLALLKQQIQQCKASLSTLLASAGHGRLENAAAVSIDGLLGEILDRWRLLRPELKLSVALTGEDSASLLPDEGLAQALINLLNNAADASLANGRPKVSLRAQVSGGRLLIEIEDEGTGIDEATRALAGRAVFSTKPGGSGLGLLISNTTLSRWGGSLSLHNRPSGGTVSRIVLPLSRLSRSAHETTAAD
jgi:two-component system sensor histidine kinase RegB